MGCSSSSLKKAGETLGDIGEKASIVVTALDHNKEAILDTMEALHVNEKVIHGTEFGFAAVEITGIAAPVAAAAAAAKSD